MSNITKLAPDTFHGVLSFIMWWVNFEPSYQILTPLKQLFCKSAKKTSAGWGYDFWAAEIAKQKMVH